MAVAKKILITVGLGSVARNVLRTSVFSNLRLSGATIIIATPEYNDPAFVKEFSGDNIILVPLLPYTLHKVEAILYQCAVQLFFIINRVATFETRKKTHPRAWSVRAISRFMRFWPRSITWCYRFLAITDWLFPDKKYRDILASYPPDLMLSTNPYDLREIPLFRYSNTNRIPIVTQILSWDNLTSHLILPAQFKKILVWNQFMKQQVVELYHYHTDDVIVTGIPQFDIYKDTTNFSSRENFLASIGADPKKKLVTYTTTSSIIAPYEHEVIEILHDHIRMGKIPNAQLLVRLHPRDSMSRYESLRNLGIIFDTPGKTSERMNDNWNPTQNDMRRLAETCRYSNVMINVASTMNIDAAAFDTPIINIGFDGKHHLPYIQSVRRYYSEYTHYIAMMSCGGSRLAEDVDSLIHNINQYLADPKLDHEGRMRIVQTFCEAVDGRSGERVANAIKQSFE